VSAGLAGRPVAVAGIGYSRVSRGDAPDQRVLAADACLAAITDAGLTGADVDGIFQYSFGYESPNATHVQRMIGSPNLHAYLDIMGSGPSGLASALGGVMAVASGACETALVYRCMTQVAGKTGNVVEGPAEAAGSAQFSATYGLTGGILATIAMKKQRRLAELGTALEDYGVLAVSARKWAALNERAVLRAPITMDDYLSSRPVVDPLLLLDCDYPVNGCCAAIITTRERARDLAQTPVIVDAMAYGTGVNADWTFGDDFMFGGTIDCGKALWAGSELRPDDLDVLGLYDGFTHIAMSWVEALGLCGIGEFGDWVEGGRTIEPGGRFPLNTSGGQLAEGRLHGLGLLTEVVLQLRGGAGERQVPDAKAGAVANAHGPQCGAMLLRTE
jgi:acetyl-CoA acetyltransferase